MPAADINLGGLPLTRLNPWYPGQMGVPGTWSDTGLRQHCTGTVFYVDPNFPGASDARDGTDPTAPLLTVETALTKCEAYRGDVIAVMANQDWQYASGLGGYTTGITEEVTITVPGVRLVGVFPSSPFGVPWSPVSDGGTCITVTAMDVLIEGFAFHEGTNNLCDGIYIEWEWADNPVVRHCVFTETVATAIEIEFVWYADISYNFFQENTVCGIYSDPAGNGGAYLDIHHNRFVDCALAMTLGAVSDSVIHNNWIYNGTAEGAGAAAGEGIDTTGGADNLITNNFFSCLLPVPANGDWDDLNESAATDAWIANYCIDGMAVSQPT